MTIFLALLALAALLAVALFAGAWFFQELLLFAPERLPAYYRFDLPDVEEVPIEVPGAVLSALHLRLPDPKGIVFYLHGNAGSLAGWFADANFYRKCNFDLFMLDYRGYGKSTGRVRSEEELRSDVDAAWRGVAPQYAGKRIAFVGRSLGTALAARLAAKYRPDLTVLISPYWSIPDLARIHYPFVPGALLRYHLETFRDIARIQGLVLLIHGDRDALIPISHSERLQALAPSAQLVRAAGAAHNDIEDHPACTRAIETALARL